MMNDSRVYRECRIPVRVFNCDFRVEEGSSCFMLALCDVYASTIFHIFHCNDFLSHNIRILVRPLTEISMKDEKMFLWNIARLARKADILTALCESIV
jgi:hypothetical protein